MKFIVTTKLKSCPDCLLKEFIVDIPEYLLEYYREAQVNWDNILARYVYDFKNLYTIENIKKLDGELILVRDYIN